MTPVILVGAFKGGVSKTTTASNLAGALARQKKKVLLWDLDFQASTTLGSGYEPADMEGRSIYEAIHGVRDVREIILETKAGYFLVPSSFDLSAFDVDAFRNGIRGLDDNHIPYIIRNLVNEVRDEVDCHIIDTGPALNMLTVNAMVAADIFVVASQLRRFGVYGTVKYIEKLREIRASWVPESDYTLKVVPTFYSKGKTITTVAMQELRQQADRHNFEITDSVIPETVQYENSQTFQGIPATSHLKPTDPYAKVYFDLLREVTK